MRKISIKELAFSGLGLIIIAISFLLISQSSSFKEKSNLMSILQEDDDTALMNYVKKLVEEGREIFRYETFGDEAFWSDALQLDKAIAGEQNGGVGPGVSPATALQVGLKVDMDALPADVVTAIQNQEVDLNDPAVTLTLLQVNSVVGVVGNFDAENNLESIGITCAICHSTVDDAFAPGIGHRLDGWANRDLNVGAIVALAPNLQPFTDALQVHDTVVRQVLMSWGPGKFDAELNLDGKAFRPDGKPAATLLPPAFGQLGTNNHTWTGGWGNVTYWNAFVANLEMHGQGNFNDRRLANEEQYPVAARTGLDSVRNEEDLVTSKLPALHFYQLSLDAPAPPADSFDQEAAERGEMVFVGKGKCNECHFPPIFTDAGWNTHKASEIGIDDFQANRSPDSSYRTALLRGLWTHMKGGFFHDGRFATLLDVVNHYNTFRNLGLSETEKTDLVEYLKSLGGEQKDPVIPAGIRVQKEKKEVISFYPNPSGSIINVKIRDNEKITILRMFNSSGVLVKSVKVKNSRTQIDVSDLPSGVYVITGDDKKIGRFVKK